MIPFHECGFLLFLGSERLLCFVLENFERVQRGTEIPQNRQLLTKE